MIFALVGNQNCGKTTRSTAYRRQQHVETSRRHRGRHGRIVRGHADCRGNRSSGRISLRPSREERDRILSSGKPDGIITSWMGRIWSEMLSSDAQASEMRVPMVLALNMWTRCAPPRLHHVSNSGPARYPRLPHRRAKGEGSGSGGAAEPCTEKSGTASARRRSRESHSENRRRS